ncbi:hypothetical protein CDAR_523231 [Caerostris darwini]|uniref:Uncharacterized protein n=1 Tax=Caerostris darwini TaxID=1538125 RepID=A0AAV4U952_9ARAC|nr:hypothetical protein CDAR_523231 [Caerostris darwini]
MFPHVFAVRPSPDNCLIKCEDTGSNKRSDSAVSQEEIYHTAWRIMFPHVFAVRPSPDNCLIKCEDTGSNKRSNSAVRQEVLLWPFRPPFKRNEAHQVMFYQHSRREHK